MIRYLSYGSKRIKSIYVITYNIRFVLKLMEVYMIVLFSTNCPKCKVLEKKLNQANIAFSIDSNIDEVIEKGFTSAPILKVEDEYLDFGNAVKWVNNYNSIENKAG